VAGLNERLKAQNQANKSQLQDIQEEAAQKQLEMV